MKQPWYVGIMKGKGISKPTRGVGHWDGSDDIWKRHQQSQTALARPYSKGENIIMASIHAIRQKYPNKRDQLVQLRRLEAITSAASLSGYDADAIADIRLAIDEIECG